MISAPVPDDEDDRLEAVRILGIMDTVPEQSLDDLTLLAASVCATPVSFVSLIDRDRQWFKSHHGIALEQTGRDVAFCAHAILAPQQVMEIPDAAADSRFTDNPLFLGDPRFRFYAGVPLVTEAAYALGTLCVLDNKPRRLEPRQRAAVQALARQATAQLKMRSMHRALRYALESTRTYQVELEEYLSRLRGLNMQLHAQAITDPLTGLYDRLALTQQLNQAVARAKRAVEPLSLLLIDVDHLKSFNDAYGGLAGDGELRRLAQIIRSAARETDTAARSGGEKFGVVLPATAADGAATVAERIRQAVHGANWRHRDLTISVGVVTRQAGNPRCSAELLFRDADQALYRAKEEGRNRVVIAGPGHP